MRPVRVLASLAALLVVLVPPTLAAPPEQPGCNFTLGFATLRNLILAQYGDTVGPCLEDERFEPSTGNALQRTGGGLMVWRKADNWTAFTNGSLTWLNGPEGLAVRPNGGPLFPWEAPPSAGPGPSEPDPAAAPAPPPPPSEPAPQTISGRGKRVTDRFNLAAGLSIFKMRHSGSRNFIVKLIEASSGRTVEFLANEIGRFDGAQAEGIQSAGQYVLEVDADGDWSITIEQPRPTSAPQTTSFSGRGPSVTAFFSLPGGLKVVEMRHGGRSNFIVQLLDRNGRRVNFLANEIGPFSGSASTNASGIHVFGIDADGDWSINIR